jgi:hypothetical protein
MNLFREILLHIWRKPYHLMIQLALFGAFTQVARDFKPPSEAEQSTDATVEEGTFL